jgi:hypothetical protein
MTREMDFGCQESFPHCIEIGSGAYSTFYIQLPIGTRGSLLVGRGWNFEADHSLQLVPRLRMSGAILQGPICLHKLNKLRDNFSCTLLAMV